MANQETCEPDARCNRRARRYANIALYCFGVSLALLVAHIFWVPSPAVILPPAGEVIEGNVPFRFAVVGDSRGNTTIFKEILARIKADKASLILHTGDIVQHSSKPQFNWILHELREQRLDIPFCPVPGNHDVEEGSEDARVRCRLYNQAFGPRQYWFAYANALFVAFDDATERYNAEDLRWLDETLGRLRDHYELCFVYMHVPPRDPRPGKSHCLEEGAEDLIAVMKKHRVSAVFPGHIHGYLEDTVEGIPFFISGGGGARLEEAGDRHHYLLCAVEPDGSFTIEKKDIKNLLDTDSVEYILRTMFSSKPTLFASAGLLLAGCIMALRGRRCRRTVRTDC